MTDDRLEDSNNWELLLWLLGFRFRFRVKGLSMAPLLKPGDELLVDPNAYRQKLPFPGDIVVAKHPYRSDLLLVKRVASVLKDGNCFLIGNNSSESTDSRSFGSVSPEHIIGRVCCRFP
ncbi:MAG: nickel-type superoxide dismutase maturation protease [Prochloraceae cyanobacterium]|nr:nickel-type superoxide dismutase maturation protease [Prochloraceae cyanobacterium]